jgi:SAM-dependent methyltransferase
MDETSKSRKIWGDLERSILVGKGIDIGCGPDPVTPDVRCFDMADGDANHITKYVQDTFDFVYASHCLEHMHKPREAILEWWKLVKPGGHLFVLVPDEDLYEMGVFPSRFNPDHKATFTLSKSNSWSPVSINVLDLAKSLPNGELISVALQDNNYDRSRLIFGPPRLTARELYALRVYHSLRRRGLLPTIAAMESLQRQIPVDQTLLPGVSAQIQLIVRKTS